MSDFIHQVGDFDTDLPRLLQRFRFSFVNNIKVGGVSGPSAISRVSHWQCSKAISACAMGRTSSSSSKAPWFEIPMVCANTRCRHSSHPSAAAIREP
jgi:hypothetical protein